MEPSKGSIQANGATSGDLHSRPAPVAAANNQSGTTAGQDPSKTTSGFKIIDKITGKPKIKSQYAPKKPDDASEKPVSDNEASESDSDSDSDDGDDAATQKGEELQDGSKIKKSDSQNGDIDSLKLDQGVKLQIQPKDYSKPRFKRVKLEKKYIKDRWTVMELTPTPGDSILNAADQIINQVRRIRIVKPETPQVLSAQKSIPELNKKPDHEVMASVMTIIKGFKQEKIETKKPVEVPDSSKDNLKSGQEDAKSTSDDSSVTSKPTEKLELSDNLLIQKPMKTDSEPNLIKSHPKEVSSTPNFSTSSTLEHEEQSTEHKIGTCMDLVKNSMIDIVQKELGALRHEVDRLRNENHEVKDELDLIKKFMSADQLNEFEKEKNSRKKKTENSNDQSIKPLETNRIQQNNNLASNISYQTSRKVNQRVRPPIVSAAPANPRVNEVIPAENFELKNVAARVNLVNQVSQPVLSHHVANNLPSRVPSHLSHHYPDLNNLDYHQKVEKTNSDWIEQQHVPNSSKHAEQNGNNLNMEHPNLRNQIYRQAPLHDSYIHTNHDVSQQNQAMQQRAHPSYGQPKMNIPASNYPTTSLPSHAQMMHSVPQYHSVNGYHQQGGARAPPQVTHSSNQQRAAQTQNLAAQYQNQQRQQFSASQQQQQQQPNSQYYAPYNTAHSNTAK